MSGAFISVSISGAEVRYEEPDDGGRWHVLAFRYGYAWGEDRSCPHQGRESHTPPPRRRPVFAGRSTKDGAGLLKLCEEIARRNQELLHEVKVKFQRGAAGTT